MDDIEKELKITFQPYSFSEKYTKNKQNMETK